jgi:hypothetical protein
MAPICSICCDKQINYICKCNTCKKSLCLDCYDKIIIRTNNETYNYKCPFCTSENEKEIEELQPKQIIKLCSKTNEIVKKLLNDNVFLTSEILDLSAQIETLSDNEEVLKEIIENAEDTHTQIIKSYRGLLDEYQKLTIENNKLKASIPEVKMKKINKYQEFIKENFKTFKKDNPDIKNQEIFKLLAQKWKITN